MRILIGEDDQASRKFLSKFLSGYGECDISIDGIGLLDAFSKGLETGKPYDLVCIDIMMPKMDGIRALKIIRDMEKSRTKSKEPKAKIIVTTGLNEPDTIRACYENGCDKFITKPINVDQFKEILAEFGLIQGE